jgi:alpha-2-macroglobulin
MGFLDVAANVEPSEGAAAPVEANGPLDAYLYTDRSLYQPGETVFLSGLLRDADAVAVQGRVLTLKIQRPDGFEVDRRQVADAGGGSYAFGLDIPRPASTGQWSVTAHLEPDGEPIGRADFVVEDFVPPRLNVELSSDREVLEPGGVAALRVDGRYRQGGAAAKLPGEVTMMLRQAANPYPKYQGYRFGLVQEGLAPIKADAPGFITGADGSAKVELRLPELPDTTQQLEAVIQGKLYDIGGRPSVREITLPVRHQPFSIGIKPRFEGDAVPEGATAAFDVIALDPGGNPIGKPALSYELFEEDNDYAWFEAGGHWDYRIQVKDKRLTGGSIAVTGAAPAAEGHAAIEQPVGSGRYRLEVFDPETGVATSVRFSAGWWVTATSGDRPDRVEVAVMMPKYSGGETARVFVRPPYQAQVLVTVADRRVHQTMIRRIGPEGAFMEVPVDPSWTAGVHVIATAFAPADPVHKVASRRAVGTGWLAVDPAPRRLNVTISAPADMAPRHHVSVPVKVTGAEEGAQVRLTLAAVDDAMLQLTEFAAPDPVAHYLGRRPLEVDLRDVRGRLVEQDGAVPLPRVKPSAGPTVRRRGNDPQPRRREMTALYSGVVTLGPDGTTEVPLDIPDFDGRLRLMAVAWTPAKAGNAVAVATVRDPVMADLSMPRFLAPGDTAQVTLTLNDRGQKAGDYAVRVSADGKVALRDGGDVTVPPLRPGKPVSVPFTILGTGVGNGTVQVEITGPEGFSLTREWPIGVRRVLPTTTRRQVELIEPGRKAAVAPDTVPELTALRSETVSVMLTVGTLPDLDLTGLLLSLERYPYGSAEQITSRAMPLLQLGPVAAELDIASVEMVRNRIQRSIDRLMTVQRADGAFAMWSAQGPAEMWLTAYVVDFLGRARDAGYRVPELPLRKGIEWLNGVLDNAWFDEVELAARAYALYTLAGAKAVDLAEVRYFQETWWTELPTRLARAQIASALARLGDGARAAEAFNQLERNRAEPAGMRDFGSDLRDQAAVIALLAENNGGNRDRLLSQTQQLATRLADAEATSTQEQAWVLMASAALASKSGEMKLTVDGTPVTLSKPLYRRLDPGGGAVTLENTGVASLWRAVTLAGVPVDPPPAEEQSFRIERKILDMEGKPVDPGHIGRDRLLVVILEGESLQKDYHQALVVDMLPAGLEIENVRLADSGQLGDLSWLGTLSAVNHVEYRDDRFVAALDLKPEQPAFRLVYLVRAVTPGDYAMPGAYVEDMYSPNLFARGEAGRLVVGAE